MLYMTAARINENGDAHGGTKGDQTGKEVMVQQYADYSRGWDGVLRLKQCEMSKAKYQRALNRLMHCAYLFAENDHIGYDQDTRGTLYDYMVKRNWKMSQIEHISQNLSCDCSLLMGVVVNCALKPIKAISKAVPKDIYTGNMRQYLLERGFSWVSNGINWNTGNGLKRGDLLLNEEHHTALFMGNVPQGQYYC